MARVSIYDQWKEDDELENILIKLEGWARQGLSQPQLSKNLGISLKTFQQNMKRYLPFRQAVKKGKEVADFEVENALYKRAKGYSYEEITKELIIIDNETGEKELRVTKVITKHQAPDNVSMIFWLKNRMPQQWKNNPDGDNTDDRAYKALDDFTKALGKTPIPSREQDEDI